MANLNLFFPPFRLDRENQVLWHETRLVPLRPKTFAVFRYLVEHTGQIVNRAELSTAVWSATKITPQVLRASIRELRQALGDTADQPRFIETVGQQGWRFIAPVAVGAVPVSSPMFQVPSAPPHPTPNPQLLAPILVGREAELTQLHQLFVKAAAGARQIVFVTGEPGIGKTTLIDAFTASLATDPRIWVARGQCIEHYGVGEAYMPVLAALEQLTQNMADDILVTLLQRYAPLWLAQMPSLLEPAARAELQGQLAGATRERMVRELAVLLEVLTAEHPLVLVLEDLHWSDHATVELLAFLARRRETARLLVLGAYRPVEMLSGEHPLRHLLGELSAHQQCTELPLAALSETAVALYFNKRFPNSALPVRFAHLLHERTGGNPLFLVTVVEDLVTRELLKETDGSWSLQLPLVDLPLGAPESLRHFLTEQMQRLPIEDRRVLEAGSVAGAEFSAAAVATALAEAEAEVEERCEHLARQRQFLRQAGISEWPDGTQAARYGFSHALHQQLWHERVTPTRRQQWHRRIGKRLEEAYGQRTSEIAAELAVHFEEGRNYQQAVRYLQLAGRNAMQRNAPAEAIHHFTRGLELLKILPTTRERDQQEVALQIALGAPLGATKGVGAPEVEQVFSRARELCAQLGQSPELIPALWGLCWFSIGQGNPQVARELGEQLLGLVQESPHILSQVLAYNALGAALFWTGDFPRARFYLEQGMALYDPQQHHSPAYVTDLGVLCRCYAMLVLWSLGYPDQARSMARETLTIAYELSHAHSLAQTACHAALVHQLCREGRSTQESAECAVTVSAEQGFPLWSVTGLIVQAWTLAEQGQIEEGAARLHQALTRYSAINSSIIYPYFLGLLADAQRKAARPEEGLAVVTEALTRVEQTGARYYEAELWRLKGELLLAQART